MRKVVFVLLTGAGLTFLGCRTTQVSSDQGVSAPTEDARPGFVPEGSTLQVELNQTLGTEVSREGDPFTATVQAALTDPNGRVVVPSGAQVRGTVTGLKRSERAGDQAAIKLAVSSIEVAGQRSSLTAEVVETKVESKDVDRRRGGIGAGIGAAAGTVLGAVISHSVGGALLGGLLGAGAGTVIGLGTGNVPPKLPAGTDLSLRTTAPAKIAVVRAGGPT